MKLPQDEEARQPVEDAPQTEEEPESDSDSPGVTTGQTMSQPSQNDGLDVDNFQSRETTQQSVLPRLGNVVPLTHQVRVEIIFENTFTSQSVKTTALEFTRKVAVAIDPALYGALNQLREENDADFNAANQQSVFIAGSGTLATTFLTAGIAAQILRSGALLASWVTSAPLWKPLDPIPVLSSPGENEPLRNGPNS